MTYDHWKTTEPDPFAHDEPPQQWAECAVCDGLGYLITRVTVYEHGCGFPHDDSHEIPCDACGGAGGWVDNAEPTRTFSGG